MIYALAYLIGFVATAVAVIRYEHHKYQHVDADDQVLIGIQGFLAGIVWPLVAIGFGLYRLATRTSTEGSSK